MKTAGGPARDHGNAGQPPARAVPEGRLRAHLRQAASLDPAAAAAHLDAAIAACDEQVRLLDSCEDHLQTLAEVREHDAVRAVLERERGAYAAVRAALGEPHRIHKDRSGRVVVADDDAEIRAMVAAALRHHGHEVAEARDGLELLTLLSKISTQDLAAPAAIVSDVRMPIFDGLDALRNARSFGLDVPFILMTAYRDPHIRACAEELGASALLDKPFEMEQLLRRVSDAVESAA